ncbi:serine/threonine-protein phosphatase 4 regulatory subunit 4 isoform X1 [Tachysurus ichikawai]
MFISKMTLSQSGMFGQIDDLQDLTFIERPIRRSLKHEEVFEIRMHREEEEEEEEAEEAALGFSEHPFLGGRFHRRSALANERSPGVIDSPPPRLLAHALLSLFFFPRSPSCFASSQPHHPRM